MPKKVTPRQKTKLDAKRERIAARERFKRARLAERSFARRLNQVAHEIGKIINRFAPRGQMKVGDLPKLTKTLTKYAEMLKPWAKKVSESMVAEVGRRDILSWAQLGRQLGQSLRKEIAEAPTGRVMRDLMEEQVDLITSLPMEAAQRVHKLTIEGMSGGTRAREVAKEIMKSGQVSKSRAMLIARTETTRTATAMVESRARFLGSEGYIWHTAGDSDVRELHRKLDNKFIRWDDPPIAGERGERAHAGAIYNCRCWPEPIIPDTLS